MPLPNADFTAGDVTENDFLTDFLATLETGLPGFLFKSFFLFAFFFWLFRVCVCVR